MEHKLVWIEHKFCVTLQQHKLVRNQRIYMLAFDERKYCVQSTHALCSQL
jgi:hypothetical protein